MTHKESIATHLMQALSLASGRETPVLTYLIEMALLENEAQGDDTSPVDKSAVFLKPARRSHLTVVKTV